MAQDDTTRDDGTQQEFNEDDRVDETLRSNEVDPADVRDDDMTSLEDDTEDVA
jgi:hypothetical protein